jgi:hypothetical protein
MTSTVLDLDEPDSWHPQFEALLYCARMWQRIREKLDDRADSTPDLLSQITCCTPYLSNSLATEIREKARQICLANYTYVAAYHGCRPRDRRTYQQSGILLSDPQALVSYARELFAGIAGFDEALNDIERCGRGYLDFNKGKVGLLMSGSEAKRTRNPYANGSELVRALASRLGREAKRRVADTGMPTLIRCIIPVNWLDRCTTFPVFESYCSSVLDRLIRIRRWPKDPPPGFDGGFLLTRSVPQEYITDFIDMTDFSDERSDTFFE